MTNMPQSKAASSDERFSLGSPAGHFVARVVRPGGLLYHGIAKTFSRQPSAFEKDHIIIEIYDTRYADPAGAGAAVVPPIGQFVTAYGAQTLADRGMSGRLSMHGGIEGWTLSGTETASLCGLAYGLINGVEGKSK